ncbi:MAG: putative addiction module antidote protein [Roseitalea porphyridii]|jgi:probable addiction module antidote protein|uniref:addiction module antidote protein n=1 Tax=Roseitalea porphyridii TaxID=1852022 RepID=UPI0032EB8213
MTKTEPFDAARYLESEEGQRDLIADALESGDPAYLKHALNIVARARGMTAVARDAGVAREALYRALSENGDPRLSTLMGVFKALDVQLTACTADHPAGAHTPD